MIASSVLWLAALAKRTLESTGIDLNSSSASRCRHTEVFANCPMISDLPFSAVQLQSMPRKNVTQPSSSNALASNHCHKRHSMRHTCARPSHDANGGGTPAFQSAYGLKISTM